MKRIIAPLIILIAIFVCGNSTNDNFSITSKTYLAPANSAFTDQNFYNCVVATYNTISGAALSNTTKLTDAQLKTITELNCYNKSISNVKGLEKMPNLTLLSLGDNNISSIDLSKHTALTSLHIYGNNLTSLDLSNNTKLTRFSAYRNNLTSIDLSNNVLLTEVYLDNNNLANLDVSNNTKLTYLTVYENPLVEDFVVYKNEQIDFLDLDSSLKLFDGKSLSYIYISSVPQSFTRVDMGIYYSKTAGTYQAAIEYRHNVHDGQTNNHLDITHNIYVVEATSDQYQINETDNYIYTGTNIDSNSILSGVNLNYGTKEISNNKLNIKYNSDLLKTFDIVNIKSDVYDLSKDYIYLANTSLNVDDIVVTNGQASVDNNTLNINKGDTTLGSYEIVSFNLDNLTKEDNYVISDSEVDYSGFQNKLTTNGVTYKLFNGEDEVTNNLLATGMNLEVYKDSTVLDEYLLVIKGDITGDGNIKMGDIMKAANQILDNTTIVETCYLKAADITGDGEIKMSDVMKLASYVLERGEI